MKSWSLIHNKSKLWMQFICFVLFQVLSSLPPAPRLFPTFLTEFHNLQTQLASTWMWQNNVIVYNNLSHANYLRSQKIIENNILTWTLHTQLFSIGHNFFPLSFLHFKIVWIDQRHSISKWNIQIFSEKFLLFNSYLFDVN